MYPYQNEMFAASLRQACSKFAANKSMYQNSMPEVCSKCSQQHTVCHLRFIVCCQGHICTSSGTLNDLMHICARSMPQFSLRCLLFIQCARSVPEMFLLTIKITVCQKCAIKIQERLVCFVTDLSKNGLSVHIRFRSLRQF